MSLEKGLAVVKMKPGNTATLKQLIEAITKNGFTMKDSSATVAGTVVITDGKPTLRVSGSNALLQNDLLQLVPQSPSAPNGASMVGKNVVVEGIIPEAPKGKAPDSIRYQSIGGRKMKMNTVAPGANQRSRLLNYFSLFTSLSTLLCCALPSLLVLFGLGASVASMLSFMPWLVTLSRHKQWTFAISGVLIVLSFVNMYYISPRIRAKGCSPDDPSACEEASNLSKALLWVSAGIYMIGIFVAYALGPILWRLDNG